MKQLFLFFGLALAASAAVTGVTADNISYSSWRLRLTGGGAYGAARFYFSVAPLSCLTVTAGVKLESIPYENGLKAPNTAYATMDTSGKVPDTLYNVCVQTNTSGTWTYGPMIQVRTLPAPRMGYRIPPHALKVDTSYPADLTDSAVTVTATVTSNCSSFLTEFNAAIARQATKNTIILLPLTTCQGTVTLDQTPVDVKVLAGGDVQGDGSLYVFAHGWSDNQAVIVARSGDYSGATPYGIIRIQGDNPPGSERPDGRLYYARVKDANTVFLCEKPPSQGGTNITLSSAGTGTYYVMAYPRALKWIIIRTVTPDDQFVPPGVSLGALGGTAWIPKMAKFTNPIANHSYTGRPIIEFIDANQDAKRQSVLANIRFIGIVWTVADDPVSYTTVDPPSWNFFLSPQPTQQNIIIDRCIFMTPSIQQRVYTAFKFQGLNSAVVHSIFDKTINFFFPKNEGGVQ